MWAVVHMLTTYEDDWDPEVTLHKSLSDAEDYALAECKKMVEENLDDGEEFDDQKGSTYGDWYGINFWAPWLGHSMNTWCHDHMWCIVKVKE